MSSVRQFLPSTINSYVSLPWCFCVFSCTRTNYTGVFVAEKNALKLTVTSVKTKQMVFLQQRAKAKCCGSELWEDLHAVSGR